MKKVKNLLQNLLFLALVSLIQIKSQISKLRNMQSLNNSLNDSFNFANHVNPKLMEYLNCQSEGKFIYLEECVESCPIGLPTLGGLCIIEWEYIESSISQKSLLSTNNYVIDPPPKSLVTPVNCRVYSQFYFNGACLNECPLNYFADANSVCQNCEFYSTNNPDYTKKCNCNVKGLVNYNGLCLSNCPNNYYKDAYDTCKTCSSLQPNEVALKCCKPGNKYFYNNQCVNQCPDNFYVDENNYCQSCSIFDSAAANNFIKLCCKTETQILNNKKCSYCKELNLFLSEGQCMTTCPFNAAADFANYICDTCKDTSKFLYKNQCLSACPTGSQTDNNNICVEQSTQCSATSCQHGGECSVQNNQIVCDCSVISSLVKYSGKYCEFEQSYVQNYTEAYNESISTDTTQVNSNYINNLRSQYEFVNQNNPTFFNQTIDKSTAKVVNVLNNYVQYSSGQPTNSAAFLADSVISQIKNSQSTNASLSQVSTIINNLVTKNITYNMENGGSNSYTKQYGNFVIQVQDFNSLLVKLNGYSQISIPSDCQTKIKQYLGITNGEALPFKNIEVNVAKSENLSETEVSFGIVDPKTGQTKNLNIHKICGENSNAAVLIPVSQVPNFNATKVQEYESKDINLTNPNDPYFTDLCLKNYPDPQDQLPQKLRENNFPGVKINCGACYYQGVVQQQSDNGTTHLFVYCNCVSKWIANLKSEKVSLTSVFKSITDTRLALVKCPGTAFTRKLWANIALYYGAGLLILTIIGVIVLSYKNKPNIIELYKNDGQTYYPELGEFKEFYNTHIKENQHMTFDEQITLYEINYALKLDDIIEFDDRPRLVFLWDTLKYNNWILSPFFLKSVVRHPSITLTMVSLRITIMFGLTGVFLSDSYIAAMAKPQAKNPPLSEVLQTNFQTKFWSFILGNIFVTILNTLSDSNSKRQRRLLNEHILSLNREYINIGIETYHKNMHKIYVIVVSVSLTLHLFWWYFLICLCGVYSMSAMRWFYEALSSLIFAIIWENGKCFLHWLAWMLAKQDKNIKSCIKFQILFKISYLILNFL